MFDINVNEADASLAKYQRAIRLKPNVPGVLAHQLGWVVERKGITEVLVSFRGLEDLIRQHEGVVDQDVAVEETVAEQTTDEQVEDTKPVRAPRKAKTVKETASAE